MTIGEFAALANARKTGRNRWVAKCPAHPDRQPSLCITSGKKTAILFRCMSQQCDPRAILGALGLTWASVLGEELSDAARARIREKAQLKRMELYWAAAMLNKVIGDQRAYWAAAVRRMDQEMYWLNFQEPRWLEKRRDEPFDDSGLPDSNASCCPDQTCRFCSLRWSFERKSDGLPEHRNRAGAPRP